MTGNVNIIGSMLGNTSESRVKEQVMNIPVDMLVPYRNHRFTLYSGERRNDMLESIRRNGILSPVIVQLINDGEEYEILVGHNRVSCAKELEYESVPCIVKKNLSEAEAETYVVESNLIQRGFTDLRTTEKAYVLKSRMEEMFSEEKRQLIREELESIDKGEQGGSESGRKDVAVADEYGLSRATVCRYIRVGHIESETIKIWIDEGDISVRAAVELSYIPTDMLDRIAELVSNPKMQLTEVNAKKLRKEVTEHGFHEDTILYILTGLKADAEEDDDSESEASEKDSETKSVRIRIPGWLIDKYFTDSDGKPFRKVEIEDVIIDLVENCME